MQKKIFSIIQILFILVISLFIIFIFALNLMFLKADASPSVLGYNVFLLSTSNMEPQIMKDSAVFASTEKIEMLENGNVILCYIGESKSKAVMRIRDSEAIDGVTYYTVAEDSEGSVSISVSKEDVIARCIYSSGQLGEFIILAKSTKGILLFIVIPCMALIVLQVVNIIRSRKRRKNIPIPVPEFEGLEELTLFDNEKYPIKNNELNSRRQSLIENFADKTENSNINPIAPKKKKSNKPSQNKNMVEESISRISELENTGHAKSISQSLDEVALKQVEQEVKTNHPKPILPKLNPQPEELPAVAYENFENTDDLNTPNPETQASENEEVMISSVVSAFDKPEPMTNFDGEAKTPVPSIEAVESPVIAIAKDDKSLQEEPKENLKSQEAKPSVPQKRKAVKRRPRRSANTDIEDLMKMIDDKNIDI